MGKGRGKPDAAALSEKAAALRVAFDHVGWSVSMLTVMLEPNHQDPTMWGAMEAIHGRLEDLQVLAGEVSDGIAGLLAWHEARTRLEMVQAGDR